MEYIYRGLALIFAGSLVSVLGRLLISPPVSTPTISLLCLVAVILILYGIGIASIIAHKSRLLIRKRIKVIGVLNDMMWNSDNTEISAWTDISPVDWKNAIETYIRANGIKIKVKLINTKDNFDWYAAILNPYGGVYPERSLKEHATLNKIFNYVEDGGIFVNVADIPGYWAYNPLLKRRLDATPQIYGTVMDKFGHITFVPARLFELTPFMEKLGLRVRNSENQNNFSDWSFDSKFSISEQLKISVDRVAIVEKNVEPIIKPQKINNIEVTPIFYSKYGDGKFLISLIWFGQLRNVNKPVVDLLIKIITKELYN
ncbi:MAG: hypothetical protein PHO03_01075 [Candidatus Omnitrophica bacterium]|nr:hypothetical protein [Candidatus Omnitrophota bacterium]